MNRGNTFQACMIQVHINYRTKKLKIKNIKFQATGKCGLLKLEYLLRKIKKIMFFIDLEQLNH